MSSATLPEDGFVVIHDAEGWEAGDTVGSVLDALAYLEPGTSENLTVTLDEELQEETTLTAMAHRDTNDNQAYDFVDTNGDEDGPYVSDDP